MSFLTTDVHLPPIWQVIPSTARLPSEHKLSTGAYLGYNLQFDGHSLRGRPSADRGYHTPFPVQYQADKWDARSSLELGSLNQVYRGYKRPYDSLSDGRDGYVDETEERVNKEAKLEAQKRAHTQKERDRRASLSSKIYQIGTLIKIKDPRRKAKVKILEAAENYIKVSMARDARIGSLKRRIKARKTTDETRDLADALEFVNGRTITPTEDNRSTMSLSDDTDVSRRRMPTDAFTLGQGELRATVDYFDIHNSEEIKACPSYSSSSTTSDSSSSHSSL